MDLSSHNKASNCLHNKADRKCIQCEKLNYLDMKKNIAGGAQLEATLCLPYRAWLGLEGSIY